METSVQNSRNSESEGRDFRPKQVAGFRFHEIASLHRPDLGRQGTKTRVFERLTRPQKRLLAHHPVTPDRLLVRVAIGNDPLAAQQPGRLLAFVCYSDAIGEEKVSLPRLAPLREVKRLDLDTNPTGCGTGHGRQFTRGEGGGRAKGEGRRAKETTWLTSTSTSRLACPVPWHTLRGRLDQTDIASSG